MFADLAQLLPIIIPFALLDLTLKVICLVSLFKSAEEVKGSRLLWILAVLFINIFGSVAYLTFGRERM